MTCQAALGELQRHRPTALVLEVDEQGVVGGAVDGHGLVHAARGGADDLALGGDPRTDQELGGGTHHRSLEQPQDRRTHRALERRGAGQPRAERHGGVDDQVDAGHGQALAGQGPQHAGGVPGPAGGAAGAAVGQVTDERVVLLEAEQPDSAVVAGTGSGSRAVGQRDRQDEPGVVVGVLAHQVDPARGTAEHGRSSVGEALERRDEQVGAVLGLQHPHGRHPRSSTS